MGISNAMIDYSSFGQAQKYYKFCGYEPIETPWLVSQEAILCTLPVGRSPITCPHGSLIGSGEQGFIQLMLDGLLKPGLYQTITPCFRDEKTYDDLHRLYFFKLELIWYQPCVASESFLVVREHALRYFLSRSSGEDRVNLVKTDEGSDIEINGIEVGSYGIRNIGSDHWWVYGTGLAEPRFSQAVKRNV